MAPPRLYLDWNATAPLHPAARAAIMRAIDVFGNPNSVHGEGRAARAAIEGARRKVAALVGTDAGNVVFTSGATEAANLALTPDFRMGRTPLRLGQLYFSAIEHPAVREGGRFARDKMTEIPVTEAGVVDLDALSKLLDAHDKAAGLPMVAVMLVNNETGIVQPVEAAAKIVHAHGGLFVVDAVQAAGRIALDIGKIGADFMIVSSHKIGGPKGAGALIAQGEALMPKPLIQGGGQERGHRSGTQNSLALIGFGAAAEAAADELEARNAAIGALRERLEAGMREVAADVMIHGEGGERVANTIFFTLPGLKAETGQIAFDLEGVALSAGSACSSGRLGESHVLTAMGRDAKLGALRISLGFSTTEEDIDRAIAAFAKIANRRRSAGEAACPVSKLAETQISACQSG
ncbi:cysteine desulfurase family protein [Rhizobium ruizarguesonis]|jgi:cysteine desulfurase|uniref:Cysteine desulfurase n=1 Tax=Rhizobium ruizarguesonis TaxID=2081791 RepID=A0AB38I6N3_9HYPH|nr:cysteine desulfurase family protein [Rhizobium ruizarguesonis]MBY5806006.1 cysteine desulfurase [Rhizobium leguminosarum]NKL13972.1 aminotransferase class V-fold PLP-dependent enzyme [Rhizobium leguminosarum bv. viciae]MBY5846726.1 cysteine desulfurase [Rhizobium leguminosarum]MBY5895899.1 cysteine desulfurase [Rhizobium leguminosarum]NEH87636.1 aminotransferase class V-fold PLP-dependent enzyme [Rhizobium ruizarguesonis]